MTQSGDVHDGGSHSPLAHLAHELRQLAERGEAVLLFGGDATLLWATPAGAALLGKRTPSEIEGRVPDADLFPVDRISELAAGAAPLTGTRLEKLRVLVGRRSEVLTLACRRLMLDGGRSALLAVGMGRRPTIVGGPYLQVSPLPDFLTIRPTPAEPEQAVAQPVTIQNLRDRAGRPAVRVLWRTDEAGRFTSMSPEVDDLLGPGAAPAEGERMVDAAARGVLDEGGRLAEALDRRETFTGVSILCPVGGQGYLSLVMSGVPVFSADRRFEGFRGFGVSRLEALVPGPEAEHSSDAPTSVEAGSPAQEASLPAETLAPAPRDGEPPAEPGQSTAKAGKSGAVIPFAPMQGSVHGQLAATNVVPLKAAPRPAPGRPMPPSLSRTERNAFREIARALGARVEGDEEGDRPEASEPKTAPAQARADAPADAAAPETGDIAGPNPAADLDSEQGKPAAGHSEPMTGSAPEQPAAAAPAEDVERDPRSAEADQADLAPEPTAQPVKSAESHILDSSVEPADSAEPPTPLEHTEDAKQRDLIDLASNAETIFDRLPLGILVSRGDVPILMNRTLLDMLGYAGIDEFHADGGLPHLFRPGAGSDHLQGGALSVTTRAGEALAVDARLQTVQWSGLPATLVSFRRTGDQDGERKVNATEALLARREREARELRAIMDTATDGVIVIDETGRILSINRSGEALFGYDQSEIAGETFITLFAPDSHATALDYLEGLRSNGVASVLNDGREVIGRVRQGGRIPLFMTLGAVSETPERKFCAVLRDITPWKKAETDLTEAKRAAEQASAQKSDFLAKISHEIRTPLSAIIGFAEVMIEERFGPIGNERYLEYLRDIHASGGHVISLVNDLLDLSKIEAGHFDLTFVSVDVNEIVSRAVALMQPQAGTGRVVVRSALASRLPRVVADERSLRQIVLNLLSNGIKFTDPGGQVIVSTAFTDRGEVAVRIRDTGIGMTDKEIQTALEPFRQIATARRSGGTGLGLPLTKALVEANRASLNIRSAPESGTLVEVTFPTTRVLAE